MQSCTNITTNTTKMNPSDDIDVIDDSHQNSILQSRRSSKFPQQQTTTNQRKQSAKMAVAPLQSERAKKLILFQLL